MFKHIYSFIDKIKAKLSQKGQGMVEYALIIALVAGIAAIIFNSSLGASIKGAFEKASSAVDSAQDTTIPSNKTNN